MTAAIEERHPCCVRCGLPVSERGRLCQDCVYSLSVTERKHWVTPRRTLADGRRTRKVSA